ncbi:AzlC family ABC transporter permease [Streptomyces sp. NPDC005483]|uniref:AzlC family ABC transporter permease n=1 Tax=Streptomyces sp. NPDC005483 TaxID=3154882 RepID=UPI0033A854A1
MRISPPMADGPLRAARTPVASQRSAFRAAFADSASVGLGFVPLGIAFGALATQSGLDWWWAGLSATLIFGGSFEFLLIGMVTAAAPLASVAVSAFMVNLRHVFYTLSFPLHRVRGRLGKAYSTFALCDEAYALTAGEDARSWSSPRILWLQLLLHMYWAVGAVAGALLGSLIPSSVQGLDFALTALFAVLALEALRERDSDLPTPVLALLSAVTARFLMPQQMLPAAFALFTAGLLVRHRFTTRRRPHHA